MGMACVCQKGESEEETIIRILSTMHLSDIEVNSAYNEFLKCINQDEKYLDFFLFKNYLNKIIGENNYKHAQMTFFENLRKLDKKQANIKIIGTIIIYLAKGNNYQKKEILIEHFEKFYDSFDDLTVKIFIGDLIESNTNVCLASFKTNLGSDGVEAMSEIWNNARKAKLASNIFQNFESIKSKHIFNYRTPIKRIEKFDKSDTIKPLSLTGQMSQFSQLDQLTQCNQLNQSFENDMIISEGNPNNKDPNKVITFKNTMKEDICEYFEKHNKAQSEQFFSSSGFKFNARKLSEQQKVIKEFIDLSFSQLSGEYIRTWLYDDFMREKAVEEMKG
jgi:hypothetical protein